MTWIQIFFFSVLCNALLATDSITLGAPGAVTENQSGQVAGTLTGSLNGNFATSFQIDPAVSEGANWQIDNTNHHLVIKPGVTFNYETTQFVDVGIIATKGGQDFSATVRVQILDANDPPDSPTFTASPFNEETLGATVGSLSATDEDVGDTQTFSVPANSGYRILNGTELALAANKKLDFENTATRGAYAANSVTVTVTDFDGLTATRVVTVTPTDINEAPTALAMTPVACPEETLGATVGTLSASDIDVGDTLTYSVPIGSGYRIINGNQLALATDAKLDLEDASVHGAYASRSVVVTVTDSGHLTTTLNVTVTPTNVNEAPTNLALTNSTCAEETLGATIGTLSSTDVDAGDAKIYSVPIGSGYRIINSTQLALAVDRKLDFEDAAVRGAYASRLVVVTVTDGGGLTATLNVTVTPTPVNEPPFNLTIAQAPPLEETSGASVGIVSAQDPDAGDSLTFSVAVNSGYRIINGTTLALATDRKLDFEDASVRGAYASRSVTVTATDGGGLTTTSVVIVTPTNINGKRSAVETSA